MTPEQAHDKLIGYFARPWCEKCPEVAQTGLVLWKALAAKDAELAAVKEEKAFDEHRLSEAFERINNQIEHLSEKDARIADLVAQLADLNDILSSMRDENHRLAERLAGTNEQIEQLRAVLDRPLHDDANVLLNRCEAGDPLSLAEQQELFRWLEERGHTIAEQEARIAELETTLGSGSFGA